MKAITTHLKVEVRHGGPYQPNVQGLVERFNQTLRIGITNITTLTTPLSVQLLSRPCSGGLILNIIQFL